MSDNVSSSYTTEMPPKALSRCKFGFLNPVTDKQGKLKKNLKILAHKVKNAQVVILTLIIK